MGEPIPCSWVLENRGPGTAVASLRLFGDRVSFADLACPDGRVLRGRFHGSAFVVIDCGAIITVSALLEPRGRGLHTVRTTLFTRSETIGCVHTVIVNPAGR